MPIRQKKMRSLHSWGAIIISVPFIIVLISGLFLQVKKEFDWIQPPTQTGSTQQPGLSFSKMLDIARNVPELKVNNWQDIDRLDVRPDKGVVKIRGNNNWEVQIDASTGDILQKAYRRSDIIESLHDGSWFHEYAKLWIFLPSALIVTGLWVTGVYLYAIPYYSRRKHRKRRQQGQSIYQQ